MVIDTDHLPDWAIYVIIGGGILSFILIVWAIEYVLGCLTCQPCRNCYKRIRQIIYILCCCCLCPTNHEKIEYARVEDLI